MRPFEPSTHPAVDWICVLICWGLLGGIIYFGFATYSTLRAQEHHHRHHADYQNWINKAGEGCCNNQDCGEIKEGDERSSNGFLEVRVEGQWCPILSKHYLKSGNVPNASTSHVCVWHPASKPGLGPCARLLCYQPQPGI
jgi:hypothetical protein